MRRELYFIGDTSLLQLTVGWAPWGATVLFIVGIFRAILDLLESLGGTTMFRILVNLELRTFCSRAGLEYNFYELAAKRGVANFNEQRSFSWRVMEPDGSSHDQRIMAVGCEHGEMWLKVSNAWAKIYLQWWLPRVCSAFIPCHFILKLVRSFVRSFVRSCTRFALVRDDLNKCISTHRERRGGEKGKRCILLRLVRGSSIIIFCFWSRNCHFLIARTDVRSPFVEWLSFSTTTGRTAAKWRRSCRTFFPEASLW